MVDAIRAGGRDEAQSSRRHASFSYTSRFALRRSTVFLFFSPVASDASSRKGRLTENCGIEREREKDDCRDNDFMATHISVPGFDKRNRSIDHPSPFVPRASLRDGLQTVDRGEFPHRLSRAQSVMRVVSESLTVTATVAAANATPSYRCKLPVTEPPAGHFHASFAGLRARTHSWDASPVARCAPLPYRCNPLTVEWPFLTISWMSEYF